MALFKKNTDEEEDYEEVEETVVKRRPKNKTFRDLNSENKKKRKEPPKPWGKRERYLLLFVIAATVGTSAILSMSAREWKLPGLPRLTSPFSQIRSFFGEETVIVEGNKKAKVQAEQITADFMALTNELSGVYGLYVVNLDNGFSYGVNEKDTFQAASLIKLPVIAAMYMEAEAGNINLDQKYILKNADKVAGAGSLFGKPTGYEITYRNLVKLMGKQSDNTAFNICRKLLGDTKIEGTIQKIGMSSTSLVVNETTPSDMGTFFEGLWNGNIVNQENTAEIVETLTDTIYEEWLAAGIPEDVKVTHKYGREVHVVNDAGIVQIDDPYVVVIMTKGVVEREADKIFPELSRLVYEGQME